jgi:hypothetical protein
MELMTIGLIALIVIAVLGIGYFLIPFLKRKGWFSTEDAKGTTQLMELIGAILKNVDFNNKNLQDKVNLIFEITETSVKYVEQTMTTEDNSKKKEYAVSTVEQILAQLNIELTDEIKHLIEVGIESAVNSLPATNK